MLDKIIGRSASSDEEHWISVSDLMAGLMVIFLFIAITYIRPIVKVQDRIEEIVVAWSESEVAIFEALEIEFHDDLSRWRAELDQKTLSIRFKAPDVLFDAAAASLRPEFESILSEFFPRYLKVLAGFREGIAEVRLEGHTSSEWEGAINDDDAYFRNMSLSQARTRSVLKYSLSLPGIADQKDWARNLVTANGLSSSQLIMSNGLEDKVRSRRVEFRVRTNTKERIVRILETIQ